MIRTNATKLVDPQSIDILSIGIDYRVRKENNMFVFKKRSTLRSLTRNLIH